MTEDEINKALARQPTWKVPRTVEEALDFVAQDSGGSISEALRASPGMNYCVRLSLTTEVPSEVAKEFFRRRLNAEAEQKKGRR